MCVCSSYSLSPFESHVHVQVTVALGVSSTITIVMRWGMKSVGDCGVPWTSSGCHWTVEWKWKKPRQDGQVGKCWRIRTEEVSEMGSAATPIGISNTNLLNLNGRVFGVSGLLAISFFFLACFSTLCFICCFITEFKFIWATFRYTEVWVQPELAWVYPWLLF